MPKTVFEDENIIVFIKARGEDSEKIAQEKGYFPVHRLDRDTGGLMVMAKNSKSAAFLSEEVREDRFKKEYLAVIEGEITPAAGRLTDLLFHDKTKNRTYVVKSQRKGVKQAVLDYSIIAVNDNCSLAKIALVTGRTHQIRVQFASRGKPLYGDRKYGSIHKSSLALWAYRLEFCNPVSKKLLEFVSYPPGEEIWGEFSGIYES